MMATPNSPLVHQTSNSNTASLTSTSYDTPVTFSTVIEDDHLTIQRYSILLLKAKSPQVRSQLLREVTWRMIRHDISEDIVMRPAFISHLGQGGLEMVTHDRKDHERAKIELLALWQLPLEGNELPIAIRQFLEGLIDHMK